MRVGIGSSRWLARFSVSTGGSAFAAVSPVLTSSCHQSSDARLVNRFGPQAKVVVREVPVMQHHSPSADAEEEAGNGGEPAAAAASPRRKFRASVTFRQLGFPVEVASVMAESAEAAQENAVEMAMSSNVFFIKPQSMRDQNTRGQAGGQAQDKLAPHAMEIKRVIEALRNVAAAHGRVLKFAIRRSSDGTSAPAAPAGVDGGAAAGPTYKWICRAYVRDDWSAHSKPLLATEQTGSTPNEALVTTFRHLADTYRAEIESPEVEQEDLYELNRMLGLENRDVTLTCFATATEQTLQDRAAVGFAGSVVVMDQHDNSYTLVCKNQSAKQLAFRNLAQQVQEREHVCRDDVLSSAFSQPLLVKLRWELEGLANNVAATLANPDGSVKYSPGGVTAGTKNTLDALEVQHSSFIAPEDAAVPATVDHLTYKCAITFDGVEIASAEGKGSYRVDFDCHSNALYHLLDRFGEVAERHYGYLFPSAELLERSIRHHDSFKILQHHRGKWNCYAVLGTILNNLAGSFYNTQYKELDAFGNKFAATLVFNDGLRYEQPLIARSATMRGEAWKQACMDAIRENFPVQFAAARDMQDFDLSGDTTARGSKFKSLPREKRIQHINNLASVVLAFAEEDYGWTNIEFKVRGAPGGISNRWIAELEANVHGERERRVVFASPPHQQAKHAKRLLLYFVAKKYFPKELRYFTRLGRPDALNPEEVERQQLAQVYQASTPFVTQVLELLNRYAPDQRPITYKIVRHYNAAAIRHDNDGSMEDLLTFFNPRFKASLLGRDGQTVLAERLGDEKEGPLSVLRTLLVQACKQYVTSNDSKTLFAEYERCAPAFVTSAKDLALYLFCTFLGGDASDDEGQRPTITFDAVNFEHREWVVTAVLPALGHLAIARVTALSKKEALRQAMVVATRQNFLSMLHNFSRTSLELQAFSDDILNEEISDRPPQASGSASPSANGDSEDTAASLARVASWWALGDTPPPPQTLLRACLSRDDADHSLRHDQQANAGCGFTCRIFRVKKNEAVAKPLQRRDTAALPPLPPSLLKAKPQEIGRGTALTKSQALHLASVAALENLFEDDLKRAMAKSASYCDLPPAGI